MDSGYVGIAGAGVCLPVAGDPAELVTYLAKGGTDELGALVTLPGVPQTDLGPVEARVALCTDPDPAVAPRKLPRECRLALRATGAALPTPLPEPPGGASAGTVWVSSTAGMDEYGQICVEAATLPPGLASPMVGPQAAYNGPASAVSIRLGLTGPQLTLTGGCDAGAAAFVEASRMLHEGQCGSVLVGGSAAVSRWRPCPADGPVPAEGAVALLLSGGTGSASPSAARPLRRGRIRPSDVDTWVGLCRRPPDLVVVSAGRRWHAAVERALDGRATPCWYVEEAAGDLGAASGLLAVVAAATACGVPGAESSAALVLALGRTGNAVAIEVTSRE